MVQFKERTSTIFFSNPKYLKTVSNFLFHYEVCAAISTTCHCELAWQSHMVKL